MSLKQKLGIGFLVLASSVPVFGQEDQKPKHLDDVVAGASQPQNLFKRAGNGVYKITVNISIPKYVGEQSITEIAECDVFVRTVQNRVNIGCATPTNGQIIDIADIGRNGIGGPDDGIAWKRGYLLPPDKDDANKYANEAYAVVIDAINAALKK